jgi:hypothetical protein
MGRKILTLDAEVRLLNKDVAHPVLKFSPLCVKLKRIMCCNNRIFLPPLMHAKLIVFYGIPGLT